MWQPYIENVTALSDIAAVNFWKINILNISHKVVLLGSPCMNLEGDCSSGEYICKDGNLSWGALISKTVLII